MMKIDGVSRSNWTRFIVNQVAYCIYVLLAFLSGANQMLKDKMKRAKDFNVTNIV